MKRIILVFVIMLMFGSTFVAGQQFRVAVTDTTTLRAPGYSAAVWCGSGFTHVRWYFTIANINTSVAVALLAKKGNSQWTNVWADSLVYTKNGNYSLDDDTVALSDSLKFRFISEADGNDALITQNAALFGGN